MPSESLIVLAAGRGSRLGWRTSDLPKWLLPVEGLPLAERQLAAFPAGVLEKFDHRVVVAGFSAEAVYRFVDDREPGFEVIHNPFWGELNNWYSFLLALDHLDACGYGGSAVLVNGDLLFSSEAVRPFFDGSRPSGDIDLLVDFDRPLTEEAMKVGGEGQEPVWLNSIGKVGVDRPLGEDIGMWRLTPTGRRRFRQALRDFVGKPGCEQLWYQSALSAIIDGDLSAQRPSIVSSTPTACSAWVEVDDEADLMTAERLVQKQRDGSLHLAATR